MVVKKRGLSATAIKDFLQCKLKLVFRYDRGIISIKNDHARIGIAVHEALEKFTMRMAAKKSFPGPEDYEYALNIFMDKAVEEGLEQMGFYADGRRMVNEFIDRYNPSEEILDVEYFFDEKTPEGVPIIGAIDKVVRLNDDTIAIVDYKTARTALTPYQLQDDIQLSMYDLAASIIWPEFKNRILYLDYVRINKQVSTYRTDEDRRAFREFLSSVWAQISNLNADEVKGKLNSLCGWCDYRSYCDQYAELVKSRNLSLKPLTALSDAEFLENWETVSSLKSILDSRQRDLKMIASEKFMKGENIAAEGMELYSTQNSRTNYEVAKVAELIPTRDLLPLVTVSKGKLDRYAENDPELRNALARVADVSYNAPMFKVRKVKEEEGFELPVDVDESAA